MKLQQIDGDHSVLKRTLETGDVGLRHFDATVFGISQASGQAVNNLRYVKDFRNLTVSGNQSLVDFEPGIPVGECFRDVDDNPPDAH